VASNLEYLRELQATYTKIAERYLSVRDQMLLIPELESFLDSVNGPCVLDAGCGPGRDTRFFLGKGLKVTGIDLTKRFILLAKQRVSGADFRVMNILDLKFKDEIFHGIWCCAVLSHLRKADLQKALSEFHRVLKDGGILFVSVKAGTGEKIVREPLFDYHPRFTSFFQEDEISQHLQRAKFKVYKIYIFNERKRFGQEYRDLDYIVVFSIKLK